MFEIKQKYQNDSMKFELGVCGYPALEEIYKKENYPQVQMFYEIKEKINTENDGKLVVYPEIQTSGG